MTSPPTSPTSARIASPDASNIAAAALRRQQETPQISSAAQLAKEHEARQEFRRLIDPGIMRPNTREAAIESLKILKTLGENILREPENPKFLQFKPTNNTIKRVLMERPGALEYAIRLGFRPEVENFQPYYGFNPRKLEDLRIGIAILNEVLTLDDQKQQRMTSTKQQEKAAREAAKQQVKLAFMDDRQSVDQRVAKERLARDTIVSLPPPVVQAPVRKMPGQGQSLSGNHVAATDEMEEEDASAESDN